MWIKYIYQLLHKVEVPRTLCISEGVTHEEAAQFKMMANKLMKEGGFQWHSNIPDLKSEQSEVVQNQTWNITV